MDIRTWVGRRINGGLSKAGLKLVPFDSVVVNSEWAYRLLYFQRLFELIGNVDGDIVECGVGGGYSLAMFMVLCKSTQKRHILGFDSFSGLPAPSKQDLSTSMAVARKGALPSLESIVWDNLKNVGLDGQDNISLIRGWFSDSLPKYQGKIALLHLDADLYESTKCALENLWDKVAIGGIVALDEYQKTDEWPGEKQAVDEFIALHSGVRMLRDSICGRYYFVKEHQ